MIMFFCEWFQIMLSGPPFTDYHGIVPHVPCKGYDGMRYKFEVFEILYKRYFTIYT